MPKTTRYAVNPQTGEVYEAVPSAHWTAKLEAWRAQIHRVRAKSSYLQPTLPSPMPAGHIMFIVRKSNSDRPCAEPPTPVYSEGDGCLYAGQRLGWKTGEGYGTWHYGKLTAFADGLLAVETDDGKTVHLKPENVA